MNHVKGDMDDLFRRASEKYPLRTDSADWDRLAADLDGGSGTPSDIEAVEKRKRRGIFWWFLLIPLAGVGYFAWHATAHSKGTSTIPATTTATVKTRAAAGGASATTPASGTTDKATSGTPQATSGAPATSGTPATSGIPATIGTPATSGSPQVSGGVAKSPGTVPGPTGIASGRTARSHSKTGNLTPGSDNDLVAATIGGNGQAQANKGNKVKTTVNGNRDHFDANHTGEVGRMPSLSALDLRTVPTAGTYNLVVNVNTPVTQQDNTNTRQPPKKTVAKSKTSHGYVGVIGAPDFSTVKFQSMKGVGTTLGVLLGYSFNDRWAIESGVYLDQKKYYSSAEYFSKEGYTAYPGNNLLNVNGTCKMLEIPVNLRYNFNKSERMKWFATAGFSTYLMSNESYTGNYEGTSTGYVWPHTWDITKPSQNWFSIVNISAGFEQHIGKIGNLRIEPYLRLPLSGIGTGRLPIMSAGLNIGITHQLW